MSEVPGDLRAALAGRYEPASILGRGGMAVVYLARDCRHPRDVALKVLRGDLTVTLGAERFLKEIEIAARLVHPHILPLYDSGEAGGFLYYVMPYLEGGSLRALLDRSGPLPPDRALAIAEPVADALSYAHRTGVVHRDIKPENILFSQGHAIVADFGIARAVTSAGGAHLTRTGFPIGTPGYMSPEQAAGLTDLDARTDVYSLAVVVYEMLAGATPGGWPSDTEVLEGRFLGAPAAHRAALSSAGPAVEAALVRAMAIRPDARTPGTAALIAELRGRAPDRRRYSEDEVRTIVRRASEIEATQPTVDGSMTIGGVKDLAREVGIPTEAVREAVRELRPPAPVPVRAAPVPVAPRLPKAPPGANDVQRWLGAPSVTWHERVVDGVVSEETRWLMVERIRERLDIAGFVGNVGPQLAWSSGTPDARDIQIAVTVLEGRTHIAAREKSSNLLGATLGGIGGGLGGVGSAILAVVIARGLGTPEIVPFAVLGWLAMAFGAARLTFGIAARERQQQLRSLVDDLARIAAERTPPLLPRADTPAPTG